MCSERIRFTNPWPLCVGLLERKWNVFNPDAGVAIASSRVALFGDDFGQLLFL